MVRRGLFLLLVCLFVCLFHSSYKCGKSKSPETIEISGLFVELLGRFELPTSSLPRMCSAY